VRIASQLYQFSIVTDHRPGSLALSWRRRSLCPSCRSSGQCDEEGVYDGRRNRDQSLRPVGVWMRGVEV